MKIPDPERGLFSIPDPKVKKAPDPRSGSATLHLGRSPEQKVCVFESWGGGGGGGQKYQRVNEVPGGQGCMYRTMDPTQKRLLALVQGADNKLGQFLSQDI